MLRAWGAFLVACSAYGEEKARTDAGTDIEPDMPVVVDAGADAMDAGVRAEIVASSLPEAIDFDLTPTGYLLLRPSPSRIDSCAGETCQPLIGSAQMPPESATKTNASIAYVPFTPTFGEQLLIAQAGSDTCATNCGVDNTGGPGLYRAAPLRSSTAGRIGASVPLVVGNVRSTDGILRGNGTTQALAQHVSNGGPTSDHTTVFSGVTETATIFGRGASPSARQPFSFVAISTPRGAPAWVGSDNGLVEAIDTGTKLGVVPLLATATAVDGAAADVFAIGNSTPDGQVISFHNSGTPSVANHLFPGASKASFDLVATERTLVVIDAFGDGGTEVGMRGCLVRDVLAERCVPWTLALPLRSVIRIRTTPSAIYVLGRTQTNGFIRLVRVVLP